MQKVFLWPYDEVRVDASERGVVLEAPWIEVRVDRTADNSAELDRLVQALRTKNLRLEEAQIVTEYFEPLDEHSLCYTLPTLLPTGLDVHSTNDDLADASFSHLLTCAVRASTNGTEAERAEALTACETDRRWSWDVDAAVGFAACGDKIHPQSVFSVARRYHLLSLMENDAGKKVFAKMDSLSSDAFKPAAALMLRQNHYVTQKCEGSLLPAVEIAARAKPQVESFLREERGHDRILALALSSLDVKPEEVTVAPMTRLLMCLLEFAARRNFLAFAMAIDFFERRIYEAREPLAQLLEDRGYAEAAKRLNQHKHINDAGEHHSAGRNLLEWMAPCDPAYAREALRMAEATSYAMSQVTRAAFELRYSAKTQPLAKGRQA